MTSPNIQIDMNIFKRFSAGSANDEQYCHLWLRGASLFIEQLEGIVNYVNSDYKIEIEDIKNFENSNSTRLGEIFKRNGSDKWSHTYNILYSHIFDELGINNNLNVLEIGIGTNNPDLISTMGRFARPGASLYAFRDYLPNSNIYAGDVDRNILFNDERIKTCYIDQLDIKSFSNCTENFGDIKYDLIIDDGLHSIGANLNTLLFALNNVNLNGWIVIEDIHLINNWFGIHYILRQDPRLEIHIIKSKVQMMYCVKKIRN